MPRQQEKHLRYGSGDEVRVFRVELDRYRGDDGLLDTVERARWLRMRSAAKRRDFVAGRTAIRRVLGRLLDLEPRQVQLEYGAHGKPEVAGRRRLFFNLSHSADLALLAVSRQGPIGVDIERVRAGRPFRRLATRFFDAGEDDWLQRLPAGDVRQGFYRLWTLKEAYLKAIGTGLSLSSRDFCVDPSGDVPLLRRTPPGQEPASAWQLRVLSAEPGYAAALCTPSGRLEYCQVTLAG